MFLRPANKAKIEPHPVLKDNSLLLIKIEMAWTAEDGNQDSNLDRILVPTTTTTSRMICYRDSSKILDSIYKKIGRRRVTKSYMLISKNSSLELPTQRRNRRTCQNYTFPTKNSSHWKLAFPITNFSSMVQNTSTVLIYLSRSTFTRRAFWNNVLTEKQAESQMKKT